MATKAKKNIEKAEHAARHCLDELPYRMVVFQKLSPHGVPLYLVAGSNAPASKAEKALREAHKVHGGNCFYCKKPVTEVTIDHAEPLNAGGTDALQNLLISCKPCNAQKSHRAIEMFKPDAGREWLSALLLQVQERLNKIS